MSVPADIALVDRLRAMPTELEWLEFKRTSLAPEAVVEYVSALANAAAVARQSRAYLLFGVDDKTHDVVGTSLDPYTTKGKGNQDLMPWLGASLRPNPGVEWRVVDHPGGRVVVMEVGPARGQPVSFHGTEYIRAGTSKTELHQHPEKARAIYLANTDWSGDVCAGASLADLDPQAIQHARAQFLIKHPGQAAALSGWDDTTFLNKARVLKQGAVTNTALLLLGRPEAASLLSPVVAKMSWILKDAENRELDYEHVGPPFLLAGDRIMRRLRNLIVRTLPSGSLFPQELAQYDPWVVREALHNSIAHQDYLRQARIVVVETPDRVLITNAGQFLPGDVDTVIRQDAPQAIYRNPFLADAMVELNMIDTQGGGIKRMFETQRRRFFPMPDYDLAETGAVKVAIAGQVLDERYTRLLMERTDIGLRDVVLLDRVQKGQGVGREDHRRLKAAGLVEGRFPSLIVAGAVARATGDAGRHIRQRGLDKQYYLDLILSLIREHGPVRRKDIDDLLIPKLPDRLTPEQKQRKAHNLLQELRRAGRIANTGSRTVPQWVLGATPGGASRDS